MHNGLLAGVVWSGECTFIHSIEAGSGAGGNVCAWKISHVICSTHIVLCPFPSFLIRAVLFPQLCLKEKVLGMYLPAIFHPQFLSFSLLAQYSFLSGILFHE